MQPSPGANHGALPPDILRSRVINEIRNAMRNLRADHHLQHVDFEELRIPTTVIVTMKNTPGPVWLGERVGHAYEHKFLFEITENYPFQKPIVRWMSPIFHPNIMPADEGGAVCTKLLDVWNIESNILRFIKGIETLLITPNPSNPFDTRTCTYAAEHFNKVGYTPPMIVSSSEPKPSLKIISNESEEKAEG
jgi:ubiquitin-conjugating enzyme E2 C